MNWWDIVLIQPTVNILIVFSNALFQNFGLAVIALTLIVNGLIYPFTLKQIHASKAMQELQPKLADLQKKFAKDRQKLAQEQMKLYRESGMSPAGCIIPMLIQMPVWIALYQAIIKLLAVTPEDFLGLARYLYSWPVVYSALPLQNHFLWFDLAAPDRFMILPVLVGGTMWVQQKMVTPPSMDPRQETQSRMMLWMMPLMFAFFTLQFPSGLALFWVISSIFRIALQYFSSGWGGLLPGRATKEIVKVKKE
ncbi:MAG: membrane protein insertase YidC [Chloroflexi bacterium]|nr:membrane protein insertase YidC [Chloroflexota bacterium]